MRARLPVFAASALFAQDYIDSIAPAPDWLRKAWETSQREGLDKLTMREIDAEIRNYRQERRRKTALA